MLRIVFLCIVPISLYMMPVILSLHSSVSHHLQQLPEPIRTIKYAYANHLQQLQKLTRTTHYAYATIMSRRTVRETLQMAREFRGWGTLRRTDDNSSQQTAQRAPPCTDTSHTLACGHIVESRDPRCSILCFAPRWGTKRRPHACYFCEEASEESRFIASYSIIQAQREEMAEHRRVHEFRVPMAVWEESEDYFDEKESKLKNSLSHKCRRLLIRIGVEGIRERVERSEREVRERASRRRHEAQDRELQIQAQEWYEEELRANANELSLMREEAANEWRRNLRELSFFAALGPMESEDVREAMEVLRRQIVEHESRHPPPPEGANIAELLEQARRELGQEIERLLAEIRSWESPRALECQAATLERYANIGRPFMHDDPNISDSVMLRRIHNRTDGLRELHLDPASQRAREEAARQRFITTLQEQVRERNRPSEREIIATHEARAGCAVSDMSLQQMNDLNNEVNEDLFRELNEAGSAEEDEDDEDGFVEEDEDELDDYHEEFRRQRLARALQEQMRERNVPSELDIVARHEARAGCAIADMPLWRLHDLLSELDEEIGFVAATGGGPDHFDMEGRGRRGRGP